MGSRSATLRAGAFALLLQVPQPPPQLPPVDVAVTVVGTLPMRVKIDEVTRLLGRRQMAGSFNRPYLPTILELIMLVERNPAKPRGRAWNSVRELSIGYHAEPRHVIVEYCIDYCERDPDTGRPHPRRKMVTYRATEETFGKRLDKKLRELEKFAK